MGKKEKKETERKNEEFSVCLMVGVLKGQVYGRISGFFDGNAARDARCAH